MSTHLYGNVVFNLTGAPADINAVSNVLDRIFGLKSTNILFNLTNFIDIEVDPNSDEEAAYYDLSANAISVPLSPLTYLCPRPSGAM